MNGSGQATRRAIDPAAALALAVLAVFAALCVVDSCRAARAWPFVRPVRDDGTYRSVMRPLIPANSAIGIALELRDSPGVARFERVVFPADLDLMRERIVYGNGTRSISPVGIRIVEDLLGGKVVREPYDPVLDPATYAQLRASADMREAPRDCLVTTDREARAFRVYTDPERRVFVLVPDGSLP